MLSCRSIVPGPGRSALQHGCMSFTLCGSRRPPCCAAHFAFPAQEWKGGVEQEGKVADALLACWPILCLEREHNQAAAGLFKATFKRKAGTHPATPVRLGRVEIAAVVGCCPLDALQQGEYTQAQGCPRSRSMTCTRSTAHRASNCARFPTCPLPRQSYPPHPIPPPSPPTLPAALTTLYRGHLQAQHLYGTHGVHQAHKASVLQVCNPTVDAGWLLPPAMHCTAGMAAGAGRERVGMGNLLEVGA